MNEVFRYVLACFQCGLLENGLDIVLFAVWSCQWRRWWSCRWRWWRRNAVLHRQMLYERCPVEAFAVAPNVFCPTFMCQVSRLSSINSIEKHESFLCLSVYLSICLI